MTSARFTPVGADLTFVRSLRFLWIKGENTLLTYTSNRVVFPSLNILVSSGAEGAVTDIRHEHPAGDIKTKSHPYIVNAFGPQ
jgi:hypothetical protein